MLNRPSLSDLIIRIQNDMIVSLSNVTAIVRKAVSRVLSKVFAGVAHLLYGYIDDRSMQMFVKTAAETYLEIHADEWGITRKAPTFATGTAVFTGEIGSFIPADTLMQNGSGIQFTANDEAVIANGSTTVSVTAVEAGIAANTAAGETLSLVSPITGIDTDGSISSGGLTGGTDREDNDTLRDRILSKKRQTGLGGNENDWISWVKNFPDLQITRVWPIPQYNGIRSVGIFFTLDNESNIIPSPENVVDVQEYLETLRPVGCHPHVYAPVQVEIWYDIALYPNTQVVRHAVNDSLSSLFYRESSVGGTILLSHVREAISVATGEVDSDIIETYVDGVPAGISDITMTPGRLPIFVPGYVSYQDKA